MSYKQIYKIFQFVHKLSVSNKDYVIYNTYQPTLFLFRAIKLYAFVLGPSKA